MPHSKGFTLIELAIVIVILGVMMMLVIPTFGEITGSNLKRSTRHLTGVIRFLRDEAEAKKAVYRLRFDVQNGHYWTETLTVASDRTAEFKRVPSAISTEGSLSGNTMFKDVKAASHPDDPYILFTPDGWVEKTFVYLRDGDGKDYTLIVRPLTGATELQEGEVEER
jgi:prepilin-type N-terminal cleavage/methylation domain-containing protein